MGIARARAVEGDAVVVVMHDLGLAAPMPTGSSSCPTAGFERRAHRARS